MRNEEIWEEGKFEPKVTVMNGGGGWRRRRGGGKGGWRVAYHVIDGAECTPCVERTVLEDVARGCVLDGGVADVPDDEDDWGGGCRADGAQVVGEAEDGPVVIDRAEVGVGGVGEGTVADELLADDRVLASLPCRTHSLEKMRSQQLKCVHVARKRHTFKVAW